MGLEKEEYTKECHVTTLHERVNKRTFNNAHKNATFSFNPISLNILRLDNLDSEQKPYLK